MAEHCDVVVIGAGIGGLSAACYLAKAGKRVLVLEQYVVPGGYAHEFTRGYYSFDVSLRFVDGLTPGSIVYPVLKDLGVLHHVRFKRLDPFYTAHFPDLTIAAHADPLEYEASFIRLFPDEARGVRQLIDAMIQVSTEMRRYVADGDLGWRQPDDPVSPDRYPNLFAAMQQTWSDFMGHYLHDPRAQAVFSVLWNHMALPPTRLSAAIFILRWVSLHIYGAYYPEEGVMAMSWSLAKTLKEYGGQILYRQTVNRIETHNGRAVAVETEKGLRVEADVIISNASPPATMLNMIGRDALPPDYVRQVESLVPSLSSVVVFLGLERDLVAEGWTHHELFHCTGYDSSASYQAVLDGAYDRADMAITCYNLAYPTCAPKGGSVVALWGLASPDYADQWGSGGDLKSYQDNPNYRELKQHMIDTFLQRVSPYLPTVNTAILYQEVATPLTNMRYSLNPGGSFCGSEMTVDNTFAKRLAAQTPVPNLFLTGAWVSAGSISAVLLSGRDTARSVLAQVSG